MRNFFRVTAPQVRRCPYAYARRQDPTWNTTLSRLEQRANRQLAARERHPLLLLHSAGGNQHTVSGLPSVLVTRTAGEDQGLDDSFTFTCCRRSVTCRSISSRSHGEVRRGFCRIGGALLVSTLCSTVCMVPTSPSERENTC